MITTHSLSAEAFTELAVGAGDRAVVGQLREAQLSKHLMLLHIVAEAAGDVSPSPATTAFRAGCLLLDRVREADPGAAAALLGLPHIGSWAHDCLAYLDDGSTPDFGYLASAAAAAAVSAGIGFELDVQVRDGRVLFPGLGCLRVSGQGEWIRLSSDGERLRAGEHLDVACADLVPDDGSGHVVPHWEGTPVVRVWSGGQTWNVLLETVDRYLDRYTLPMFTAMTAADASIWRRQIQAAWDVLVRHHRWTAGPIAAGVDVIVPLVPRTDLDSATSPAAFGAIATSLPPSPVSLAETLVHEFQHIKLCGVMDMLPLIEPSDEQGYAPWREDPRPMGGILQGLYAFTGIVRFWDAQRFLETEADDVLRASVLCERWRMAIESVASTLLGSGLLTATGTRFVAALAERGRRLSFGPVPAEARAIAREVALDNSLSWQLRHVAFDATEVAGLAAAYSRGESLAGRALPKARIEAGSRQLDSLVRSRLLCLSFRDPRRYRRLSVADLTEVGEADAFLVLGDASAAVKAYGVELGMASDPAAWLGLALAKDRLSPESSRSVLTSRLPLLYEMHACLVGRGIYTDPLDLAAWFE